MVAEERMLRSLAPIPAAAPTIQGVVHVEAREADLVYDALRGGEGVLAQFYAATATDHGLLRWEAMLGLTSQPDDTLDDRRSQVIGKIIGYGAVTPDRVKAVANAFENGLVDVIEDFDGYRIILRFVSILGEPPNVPKMVALVRAMLPAHLVLEVQFTYMTWDDFDAYNAAHARLWNGFDALAILWDNLPTSAGVLA